MDDLSFRALREANERRCKRWHPGFPGDDEWSVADWSNAMCGEAGEAANVVKKLRRNECGLHARGDPSVERLTKMLAEELADIICYADLLAAKVGIDLAEAVTEKFNIVSDRQGFPETLGGYEGRAARVQEKYGCDDPTECIGNDLHRDVR